MRVRALLIIAVAGALVWLAFSMRGDRLSITPSANLETTPPPGEPLIDREQTATRQSAAADGEATEQAVCFTEFELESHPMFADEATRLEATSLAGATMDGYRVLDEATLENLSVQNDSAAMAVLGARKLLEALGDDPDLAVNLLKGEHDAIWKSTPKPLPNSIRESASAARHWFYLSALHGRVDALRYFGWTIELFDGGAVELGWIDRATYDDLSSAEKTALMPSNVYNIARLNVVPELDEGPLAEMTRSLIPSTERSVQVINKVTDKFLLDLESAGLPRPSIAATALPELPEIISMLCEDDRKRLEPVVNY